MPQVRICCFQWRELTSTEKGSGDPPKCFRRVSTASCDGCTLHVEDCLLDEPVAHSLTALAAFDLVTCSDQFLGERGHESAGICDELDVRCRDIFVLEDRFFLNCIAFACLRPTHALRRIPDVYRPRSEIWQPRPICC